MTKKTLSIFLVLTLIVSLIFGGCSPPAEQTTTAPTTTTAVTTAPEPTAMFTPGTYAVTVDGHNGPFEIDVVFSQDKITDIIIGENDESPAIGDVAMEAMRSEILERQSLNVDTIAGATMTGVYFRVAVTEAVKEAGGDPSKMQAKADKQLTTPEDTTVEVVIIGSGIAGLSTAMEASKLGLEVMVIEQLGILGGSSARAGYLMGTGTKLQAEQGITYSMDDLKARFLRAVDVTNTEAYAHAVRFVENMGVNIDWMYDLGTKFGPVNLGFQHYGPEGERLGSFLIKALENNLKTKNIDYRLNTRGDELLTDPSGAVIGVRVEAPNGEYYNIYANAVVVATGGFFANKDMTAQYFPGYENFPYDCTMGADGSGMLMAEEIGAELKNMTSGNHHAIVGFYKGVPRSLTLLAGNGGIAVNSKGERFFNESGDYTLFTKAVIDQNDDIYAIMDQTIADLPVIQNDKGLAALTLMYTVADTLEELAAKMGMDPEGLLASVEAVRESIAAGTPDAFEKPVANMRTDFTNPPYYGVKTQIENHTNFGGIATDYESRALRSDGTVIKGLYAVGECAAMKPGTAGMLSVGVFEGRIAANAIANEK